MVKSMASALQDGEIVGEAHLTIDEEEANGYRLHLAFGSQEL